MSADRRSMHRITLAFGIVSSVLAPAFCYELPVSTSPHVYFEADSARFDRSADLVALKGNVKITEQGQAPGVPARVIKAEEFNVYLSSKVAVSTGAVLVEEASDAIYGENGRFNWDLRAGRLNEVSASYDTWRILHAKSGELRGDKHIYRSASFTSCTMPEPHYRFKMSRISVIPKDRMWGFNGLLYLGSTPVFYLPFMYKPLGDDAAFVTYLDFGYSERSGEYAKVTTVHRVNKSLVSKIYLDYYTKMTFGTGLGFDFSDKKRADGSIFGYRIREPGSSRDRWALMGGFWYKFSDGLSEGPGGGTIYYTQGQLRMVSEPSFNNDYFVNNPYAISPDREASGAVVRQTSRTTTRLSYYRRETKVAGADMFVKTTETRPRVDFSAAPFSVHKLPFLNTFSGYYEHAQSTGTAYYQDNAGGRWTVMRSFPLGRQIALNPSAYYDETAAFSPRNTAGTGYNRDQYTGRYGGTLNLRAQTALGTLDITQSYQRRLEANTFSVDSSAPDRGEETNLLTVQNLYRPGRQLYAKLSSGYDFHYARGVARPVYDRIQPILAETQYSLDAAANFFVQDYYKLGAGNQAFVANADFGKPEANGITFGFANYKTSPSDFTASHGVRWHPVEKDWHLDAGISYVLRQRSGFEFSTLTAFTKTLTLYKNFHDFHTEWRLTLRPGVKVFSFMVNLKFNEKTARLPLGNETEKFGLTGGGVTR